MHNNNKKPSLSKRGQENTLSISFIKSNNNGKNEYKSKGLFSPMDNINNINTLNNECFERISKNSWYDTSCLKRNKKTDDIFLFCIETKKNDNSHTNRSYDKSENVSNDLVNTFSTLNEKRNNNIIMPINDLKTYINDEWSNENGKKKNKKINKGNCNYVNYNNNLEPYKSISINNVKRKYKNKSIIKKSYNLFKPCCHNKKEHIKNGNSLTLNAPTNVKRDMFEKCNNEFDNLLTTKCVKNQILMNNKMSLNNKDIRNVFPKYERTNSLNYYNNYDVYKINKNPNSVVKNENIYMKRYNIPQMYNDDNIYETYDENILVKDVQETKQKKININNGQSTNNNIIDHKKKTTLISQNNKNANIHSYFNNNNNYPYYNIDGHDTDSTFYEKKKKEYNVNSFLPSNTSYNSKGKKIKDDNYIYINNYTTLKKNHFDEKAKKRSLIRNPLKISHSTSKSIILKNIMNTYTNEENINSNTVLSNMKPEQEYINNYSKLCLEDKSLFYTNNETKISFTIDFKIYPPILMKNITQLNIYIENKMIKNIYISEFPQTFSVILQHCIKINNEKAYIKIKNKIIHMKETNVIKFIFFKNEKVIGCSYISITNLLNLGLEGGVFLLVEEYKNEYNKKKKYMELKNSEKQKDELPKKNSSNNFHKIPINMQEVHIMKSKIFLNYKINCPKFLINTISPSDIITTKDKIKYLEDMIREIYYSFQSYNINHTTRKGNVLTCLNDRSIRKQNQNQIIHSENNNNHNRNNNNNVNFSINTLSISNNTNEQKDNTQLMKGNEPKCYHMHINKIKENDEDIIEHNKDTMCYQEKLKMLGILNKKDDDNLSESKIDERTHTYISNEQNDLICVVNNIDENYNLQYDENVYNDITNSNDYSDKNKNNNNNIINNYNRNHFNKNIEEQEKILIPIDHFNVQENNDNVNLKEIKENIKRDNILHEVEKVNSNIENKILKTDIKNNNNIDHTSNLYYKKDDNIIKPEDDKLYNDIEEKLDIKKYISIIYKRKKHMNIIMKRKDNENYKIKKKIYTTNSIFYKKYIDKEKKIKKLKNIIEKYKKELQLSRTQVEKLKYNNHNTSILYKVFYKRIMKGNSNDSIFDNIEKNKYKSNDTFVKNKRGHILRKTCSLNVIGGFLKSKEKFIENNKNIDNNKNFDNNNNNIDNNINVVNELVKNDNYHKNFNSLINSNKDNVIFSKITTNVMLNNNKTKPLGHKMYSHEALSAYTNKYDNDIHYYSDCTYEKMIDIKKNKKQHHRYNKTFTKIKHNTTNIISSTLDIIGTNKNYEHTEKQLEILLKKNETLKEQINKLKTNDQRFLYNIRTSINKRHTTNNNKKYNIKRNIDEHFNYSTENIYNICVNKTHNPIVNIENTKKNRYSNNTRFHYPLNLIKQYSYDYTSD
ncbi:hypothetical protein PFHG_04762 [Plasmodium falciparum HB3]|uniref:Uncharacterized protein n=4 Tax=Plasmodium falciparum TaxID=5833 RepID=A0A024W0Q9_PLAFA|nr:hypothetical protein PFTANZ_04776 [Plasmodium falciparum Tanzania (2000708)]EUR65254.1 hypothetical protein PFBG_04870 [Plasmodium falciparum 7G8]KOB62987.1 hypothetical protein PFHG_04762 [Plasmodium falciparum HB3]